MIISILLSFLVFPIIGFWFTESRMKKISRDQAISGRLPRHFALLAAFWSILWLGALWILAFQGAPYLKTTSQPGLWLSIAVMVFGWIGFVVFQILVERFLIRWIHPRRWIETTIIAVLGLSSCVALMTTLGIFISLSAESFYFFQSVPLFDFLFGLQWSPQTAIRTDQVANAGSFGIVPLVTGTLLIMAIAMLVALPLGLMSAIFMSEYASSRVRSITKPFLEILAGIPTVVFGVFAALTVSPFLRDLGQSVGLSVASESALAAGLVMGIMIIPFVSSLSDDVISTVPRSLRDGSLAMGATVSETIRKVVLPAAFPGIFAAFLLAVSRAIGETMIVVMAAGLRANLTLNPLEDVTTLTVQIVNLLKGDQEFDSPKTLSVFALGLVLFLATLAMNYFALKTVRHYRTRYGQLG